MTREALCGGVEADACGCAVAALSGSGVAASGAEAPSESGVAACGTEAPSEVVPPVVAAAELDTAVAELPSGRSSCGLAGVSGRGFTPPLYAASSHATAGGRGDSGGRL